MFDKSLSIAMNANLENRFGNIVGLRVNLIKIKNVATVSKTKNYGKKAKIHIGVGLNPSTTPLVTPMDIGGGIALLSKLITRKRAQSKIRLRFNTCHWTYCNGYLIVRYYGLCYFNHIADIHVCIIQYSRIGNVLIEHRVCLLFLPGSILIIFVNNALNSFYPSIKSHIYNSTLN
jgi:hypothetical protein